MSIISDIRAKARWERAKNKVNKAAITLAKYGLGYSPTEGIAGNTKNLSKSELKKVNAAANVFGRYGAGFYSGSTPQKFTPDSVIKTAHYAPLKLADYQFAQEKAYTQANSSMHLRAGLKFVQRTIYDARLQSHPNRRILNISPEDSQEWAALTESLWRMDKECKDWDESEQNSYAQIADIAFWNYEAIGEFFCVRRLYNYEDRSTGISLQLIHPYQIQSPSFARWYSGGRYHSRAISYFNFDANCTVLVSATDYLAGMPEGNYIECGIEYDKKGREVAIFIAPEAFSDPWHRIEVKTKSGFQQVLHGFIQNEPGQKRGIPESAYAWHEFMNIADLTKYELESARLNSTIAGTVTADSNAQPGGRMPMSDLGDDASWTATGTGTELEPYKPPSYDVREVKGGGFIVQNFTPGYKYEELKTARPNVKIPEYIEKLLEFIHPAIHGISVVTVKQRFDTSYNASKGAIDLSWKNGIQYPLSQFSSDFHLPNYQAWLGAKIAFGEIAAPGWEDRRMRKAWSSATVNTPPKPSLNPLQEAKAGNERAAGGFTNRELEAQQMTGTSFEENAERLSVENRMLRQEDEETEEAEEMEESGGNNV